MPRAPLQQRLLLHCLIAVTLTRALTASPAQSPAVDTPIVLLDFNQPPRFALGTWQGHTLVSNSIATIHAPAGHGSAGHAVSLNLADHAHHTPALLVRPGPDNLSRELHLTLRDHLDRTATWVFTLPDRTPDGAFVPVFAPGAPSFNGSPSPLPPRPLDLHNIRQIQLSTPWTLSPPLNIEIDAILAIPPDPDVLARRESYARDLSAQAESERLTRQQTRTHLQRGPRSPRLDHFGLATPEHLALRILAAVPSTSNPLPAPPSGEASHLITLTADDPESYVLTSPDDPRCSPPIIPVSVHRKSKPAGFFPAQSTNPGIQHSLYLRLPFPLTEGCTYTLNASGLNTTSNAFSFTHSPRTTLCESIHVSQIGFRPADPFKRALLSLWLGPNLTAPLDNLERFELIDDQQRTVFRGLLRPTPDAAPQKAGRQADPAATVPVFAMDFGSFQTPGTYRVHIPNLGSSQPFPINEHAWSEAFKVSMHGFFSLRASPADASPPAGYLEPTDPNSPPAQLWAAYLHLELFDLFPSFFTTLKLPHLPPREATNNLPDLLDEALWNLNAHLQTHAPAVGNSQNPPLPPSDARHSLLLAACTARAARLVQPLDPALSRQLQEHALHEWNRCESQYAPPSQTTRPDPVRHSRATAAIELYWLTRQPQFHLAFTEDTVLRHPHPGPMLDQQGATFACARLPENLGDSTLKSLARQAILNTADAAASFGIAHPFGLSTELPALLELGNPGTFTVPGMISRSLPRAHFLSRDSRYLTATLRSCNFTAGANPHNLCFTTGLGSQYPRFPLLPHPLSLHLTPPPGLTVLGPTSAQLDLSVSSWMLRSPLAKQMKPAPGSWPPEESYIDLPLWPETQGYSIHQSLAPTSYTWGYLAATPPPAAAQTDGSSPTAQTF